MKPQCAVLAASLLLGLAVAARQPSVRGAAKQAPVVATHVATEHVVVKGTVPASNPVNMHAAHMALKKVRDSARARLNGRRALVEGCGVAPTYDNSRPLEFADSKKTFYNKTSGQTEDVNFLSGDVIVMECLPGYSTDGGKEGPSEYEAECTEHGYYKPHGICLKASLCGAVPNISHAIPTGKFNAGKVEFACQQGYSTDGEKVVGAFGANRFFELKCIEFSGKYEEFTGECKAYAFMPAAQTIRLYNKVSKALFKVTCVGTLKTAFGVDGKAPKGIADVCGTFTSPDPACDGLVTTITTAFDTQFAAREEFDAESEADWMEEEEDRPNIDDDAATFCKELWALLVIPPEVSE